MDGRSKMNWNPTRWTAWSGRSSSPGGQWLSWARDYFRYHGVYAPMVRFMRDVDFRTKSLLVSVTFALPVSVVLGIQFQSEWQHERQLARQVQGWQALVLADRLAADLYQQGAPVTPDNPSRALEADYLQLTQWLDQHRELAGPAEIWQRLDRDFIAWQESMSNPAVRTQRATALARDLDQLQEAVMAQTTLGLTLDPGVQAMAGLALDAWPEVIQLIRGTMPRLGQATGDASAATVEHLQAAVDNLAQRLTHSRTLGQNACALGGTGRTDWQALASQIGTATATDLAPRLDQALKDANDSRQRCLMALHDTTEVLEGAQTRRQVLLGGIMLLGLMLAVYTMVAFSRVMRGGMQLIQREVERMAQGDLSGRALPLGDDEVAITLRSLRASLLRLADLFTVVRRGVASVSHASGDISSASEALTARILEATDAIDAMHAGVGITLDYLESNQQCVSEALTCARDMSGDAGRGRRAMNHLAEVIEGLQVSSREIEKFVSLIDGIAFQTNLLALNASVEAAKAGASGKGFAVVASEVRGLANRVAEAASQISRVVNDSTSQIAQGQEIARSTVDAVRSTESHVTEMNRILGRLAQITEDGRGNAEQMTATLKDVQHNSHQTRDLVVQVEGAAKELRQQSLKLAEQSSRFKLG